MAEHWQELLVGLVAFFLLVLHQWWLHAGACRTCPYMLLCESVEYTEEDLERWEEHE